MLKQKDIKDRPGRNFNVIGVVSPRFNKTHWSIAASIVAVAALLIIALVIWVWQPGSDSGKTALQSNSHAKQQYPKGLDPKQTYPVVLPPKK